MTATQPAPDALCTICHESPQYSGTLCWVCYRDRGGDWREDYGVVEEE